MVEDKRSFWRWSFPPAQPKQGYQVLVAQDHVKTSFLQGWWLHNLPAQPVPVLGNPHGRNFFLMFRGNCLHFSLCWLSLIQTLDTIGNSSIFSSLSHQVFTSLTRFPQAICSLGWGVSACQIFLMKGAPIPRSSMWAFDELSSVCSWISLTEESRNGEFSSCGLISAKERGRIISPDHSPGQLASFWLMLAVFLDSFIFLGFNIFIKQLFLSGSQTPETMALI